MPRLRNIIALAALALVAAPAAHADVTPYVLGGSPVPQGGFPFAAYVQGATGGGTTVACTGSVIAPTLILTAAHCMFNPTTGAAIPASAFSVVTGTVNRPANPPANVSATFVYPYYNNQSFQGDAAILKLATPTAAPIVALATPADGALYVPGVQAAYAGWGETVADTPSSTPTQLQTGAVTIQPNSVCATPVEFHPGYTLCVAGASFRPATCHGDSGGPLVVTTSAGTTQIGITSYGSKVGCGIAPDYFERVSSVQSWIASVVGGTPAPGPFVPPFAAPAPPAVALVADGVTATFVAPAADPATLATGFAVTLVSSAGVAVSTQTVAPTATSATFPGIQPGSYTVTLVAAYSEGSSVPAVSPAIVLRPPSIRKHPTLLGPKVVGYRVDCRNGSWNWPGGASFTIAWLRNGKVRAGQKGPSYRVTSADAGKRIACRVTLHATTGSSASAVSRSAVAGLRLRLHKAPRIVGSAFVGSSLVCATGTWTHTGHLGIKLQWRRDGRAIRGATKARRTLVQADAGRQITCRVTVKVPSQSAWYVTASVLAR